MALFDTVIVTLIHDFRDLESGTCIVCTGRLATFRHRLPPLTFLPCGVRPADPSPPISPNTAEDECGTVTEPRLTGKVEQITDRYVVTATLGRGTFGSVLRAECRRTGIVVTVC